MAEPLRFTKDELEIITTGWCAVHGAELRDIWSENDGSRRSNGIIVYKRNIEGEEVTAPQALAAFVHCQALNYLFVGMLVNVALYDCEQSEVADHAIERMRVRKESV